MMRYLLQLLLIPTLLFAAVPHNAVAADWRVEGKGELTYPSGRKEAINFGFSYTKHFDTHIFKAGQSQIRTDSVPPNYILNVIICRPVRTVYLYRTCVVSIYTISWIFDVYDTVST